MDEILHATPGNPVPGNHVTGFFDGYRGVKLRYAIFRSEEHMSMGTVVLIQGRNESIEKYYETIKDLTARGLWVATFDLRGQGGSERLLKNPRTGHVRRFSHYVRDLEIFLEQVVLPDTRLPFFMLAHSTGGLIALSAAPRLVNRIDRMVLCAPFVGLAKQSISNSKVYWLTMLMSLFGFGARPMTKDGPLEEFATNALTSDVARFTRNQQIEETRPELAIGPPSARWLYECMKAMYRVNMPAHLYSITVPTVMIAPTREEVVSYEAEERMSQYFRAAQFVPVAGSRHEILQESDYYRGQALAAIAAFIPGSEAEEQAKQALEPSAP